MLERLPGNLEGAGGCRDIVAVAAQGRCQEILLTGIHVGFQGLGAAGRNGAWSGLADGNSFRFAGSKKIPVIVGEMTKLQNLHILSGDRECAFHHMLELTDITRPGVFQKTIHQFRIYPVDMTAVFLIEMLEKKAAQQRNVTFSFPQGWYIQNTGGQAVIQVPAQLSVLYTCQGGFV